MLKVKALNEGKLYDLLEFDELNSSFVIKMLLIFVSVLFVILGTKNTNGRHSNFINYHIVTLVCTLVVIIF